MAAVKKTPEPGQYNRPSNDLNRDSTKSTGGAFNNLIQRMTGNKDKTSVGNFNFVSKQTGNQHELNNLSGRNSSTLKTSESDRLEVPAFLRRQAN